MVWGMNDGPESHDVHFAGRGARSEIQPVLTDSTGADLSWCHDVPALCCDLSTVLSGTMSALLGFPIGVDWPLDAPAVAHCSEPVDAQQLSGVFSTALSAVDLTELAASHTTTRAQRAARLVSALDRDPDAARDNPLVDEQATEVARSLLGALAVVTKDHVVLRFEDDRGGWVDSGVRHLSLDFLGDTRPVMSAVAATFRGASPAARCRLLAERIVDAMQSRVHHDMQLVWDEDHSPQLFVPAGSDRPHLTYLFVQVCAALGIRFEARTDPHAYVAKARP